jgi:hypothetical protein
MRVAAAALVLVAKVLYVTQAVLEEEGVATTIVTLTPIGTELQIQVVVEVAMVLVVLV